MKNNIITIILVVAVGMVAFWYINKNPSDTGSTLIANINTTDSVDAKQIYNMLKQMEAVTLDDKIFVNPIFKNLKDNTVSFSPQASGRNNPFAPVGSDANIQGQTIQSTTSLNAR
ncbi:MAG: hypothetical protein WC933_02140 [Candidatus Paceibacterota bacterium]|jgi:hypothetical protein